MVYLLMDDWLYMEIDGQQGVYGTKEVRRSYKSKITKVTAAFLDYQTKQISLAAQEPKAQEALVQNAFPEDYLSSYEKLSGDLIQAIGVKEDRVKQIYDYFHDVVIESVVPYGIAVRAFLKSKNILDAHPYIIFVDDLSNQVVMTIFEGMAFSTPRRIGLREPGYMASEIKRTWHSFISEKGQIPDQPFTVVSNNREWLQAFVAQGFLTKEHIVHVDSHYVVVDGLKSAKFTMHFVPAKEVLKQKRLQVWQRRFKTIFISMLLIGLGVGAYLSAQLLERTNLSTYQELQSKLKTSQQQLSALYQNKFLSYLERYQSMDYAQVYYDFVRLIPKGYLFDNLQFQNEAMPGYWKFQATVYPQNEFVITQEFKRQFSFSEAKITSVVFNRTLSWQINLLLNVGGDES